MITIEDIRNAKARNKEETSISCEVKFSDTNDYIPYHAMRDDRDELGMVVYSAVKSEEYCKITPCTNDAILATVLATNESERSLRINYADAVIQPLMGYALAGILSESDRETFKTWNEYRKALESVDVTATDITWPKKPE